MESYIATSASPAARLDLWNSQLSNLFAGLVADPDEPDDFDGSLEWVASGSITTARAAAKRCRMYHPAASGSDQDSSYILKVQRRGRSLAEHLGQEAHLLPGDLILLDSDQSHRLTLLEDSEMLAICVPKALVSDQISKIEPLAGLRLRSDNPSVRLCSDYAESLWRLSHDYDVASFPDGSAQVLIDLLGMCAPKQVGGFDEQSRAGWTRIQHYLRDRLLEPDLTVTRISADLGVTPRRLQQIFAAKGTTPIRHVLEERLKEARRRLGDTAYNGYSITDIALEVGFGDITYFGRTFRARYGCSANSFRRSVKD